MRKFINALIHDESGVTAIEYGLLAAAVAAACAAAFTDLGNAVSARFHNLANAVRP